MSAPDPTRGRRAGGRRGRAGATVASLAACWVGCASGGPVVSRALEVHFESGAGRPAFEASSSGDAIEVFGGDGRLIVTLTPGDAGLVVRGPGGALVGSLEQRREDDGDELLVWSAADGSEGFGLEREADGDLELEDPAGETVYELKRRDYGFKVVDAEGESILRVRVSESGKISVRDRGDVTYLSTRDAIPVEVAAVWSLPGLDFVRASGFAVALWLASVGRP